MSAVQIRTKHKQRFMDKEENNLVWPVQQAYEDIWHHGSSALYHRIHCTHVVNNMYTTCSKSNRNLVSIKR